MSDGATDTTLEVVTEPLGGSVLSRLIQRGDAPAEWLRPLPRDVDGWRQEAARRAQSLSQRDWLDALSPAFAASGAAADRLAQVARLGGVVVTTGQQPGLFGGPTYTLHKALSALAIADQLAMVADVPCAPVFWAATDDADFAEARGTAVAIDGEVVDLQGSVAPKPGTPMSAALLGDVSTQLAQVERASGSAPFHAPLDWARNAYVASATIGGAFVQLLRTLLEPLGVAVLDASHPAVRSASAECLRRALQQADAISKALSTRAGEIRAAGFDPQVADIGDLSLVFAAPTGQKSRVSVAEASAVARSASDTDLSPTVLLRPLVERAILPSISYVAGPAELAYFAQVSTVADVLEQDRPLAVPRWSGTILEPHVKRALKRLGVAYTELEDEHAIEERVARARLPENVATTLSDARKALTAAMTRLSTDAAASIIPSSAVDGARAQLLRRLDRLERRYLAAVKRREVDALHRIALARSHLYPHGNRQERVLSFLPMLARQGNPLLTAVRKAAAPHAASVLGTEASRRGSAAAQESRGTGTRA